MNREILERSFEPALIKSRKGAFGKTFPLCQYRVRHRAG